MTEKIKRPSFGLVFEMFWVEDFLDSGYNFLAIHQIVMEFQLHTRVLVSHQQEKLFSASRKRFLDQSRPEF
jgi:hypothetical protein